MSNLWLVSVQVGQPQTHPADEFIDQAWTSAIVKTPLDGPVQAGLSGLAGDVQYDRKHHGGEYMAINVYPEENYARWREIPGLQAIGGGGFGENFTTRGMVESSVCVGDVYRVGEIIVAVTQPRAPCFKLARRWKVKDLTALAESEARTGYYLRVLQPGQVQANQAIEMLERPFPEWSITRIWMLLRNLSPRDDMRALAEVPALSPQWRDLFRKKAAE